MFCELSVPSAEHSADLLDLRQKAYIFLAIERLALPENEKQNLERIDFSDSAADIRNFFFGLKKNSRRDGLYACYEESINALAEGMTVSFGKSLIIPEPQKIGTLQFFQDWQKPRGGYYGKYEKAIDSCLR